MYYSLEDPNDIVLSVGISEDKLRTFPRLQARIFELVFLHRFSVCIFLDIYFPIYVYLGNLFSFGDNQLF